MKYVKQIFALKLIFCACANLVAAERSREYYVDVTGQKPSVVRAFLKSLKCRSKKNEGSMSPCFACNTGDASLECGSCHAAVYCNKDCQRQDWPFHSSICSGSDLTPELKALLRAMGAIIP